MKLEMEHHYAVWQETMLAHFGHKWIALNRGPMWQYDEDDLNSGTECVASMCRAMPCSARALKVNIFFDVDIVVKT